MHCLPDYPKWAFPASCKKESMLINPRAAQAVLGFHTRPRCSSRRSRSRAARRHCRNVSILIKRCMWIHLCRISSKRCRSACYLRRGQSPPSLIQYAFLFILSSLVGGIGSESSATLIVQHVKPALFCAFNNFIWNSNSSYFAIKTFMMYRSFSNL